MKEAYVICGPADVSSIARRLSDLTNSLLLEPESLNIEQPDLFELGLKTSDQSVVISGGNTVALRKAFIDAAIGHNRIPHIVVYNPTTERVIQRNQKQQEQFEAPSAKEKPHPILLNENNLEDWLENWLQTLNNRNLSAMKKLITPVLKEHHIPVKDWGQPQTKSVNDLASELIRNDSLLIVQNDKLFRCINVAVIDILCMKKGKLHMLKEVQILPDGSHQDRQLSTSMGETFRKGEPPLIATIRGIKEELGIIVTPEQIHPLETKLVKKQSASFVGLDTIYLEHHFTVVLSGAQIKEQYKEKEGKVRSLFKWTSLLTKDATKFFNRA